MDTPIAAVLWTWQARRDLTCVLRLLSHTERCCEELGSDNAAALVDQALNALMRGGAARKMAA
jgi:hypothetical protein